MNDREMFDRDGGNFDAGNADDVDRERGEKRERETAHGIAKFGAIGAVPGIDRVEGFEFGNTRVVDDAEKFEAGIGDGSDAIGELNERNDRPRDPDFGVIRAGGFELGKGEDAIADGAGTDE